MARSPMQVKWELPRVAHESIAQSIFFEDREPRVLCQAAFQLTARTARIALKCADNRLRNRFTGGAHDEDEGGQTEGHERMLQLPQPGWVMGQSVPIALLRAALSLLGMPVGCPAAAQDEEGPAQQ
jgi:hypothetical protein